MIMNYNIGEMIVTAKNRSTQRESSSNANLSIRNPTCTAMV